jgi:hypothetical protein
MSVVVNMRFGSMFCLNVSMRPMAVLHSSVVVPVAMSCCQVLPSAYALAGVRSVVCDMAMFVLVLYRFMDVCFD